MYCAIEDLIKKFTEEMLIRLSDDADSGAIDQTNIDDAIRFAGTLIDGHLSGRYPLPLDPVPDLLKVIAQDLTIYQLYGRRLQLEIPKAVEDKYKNALKLLEQIRKGTILLGIETAQTGSAGNYKTNKTANDRIFTKEVLDI